MRVGNLRFSAPLASQLSCLFGAFKEQHIEVMLSCPIASQMQKQAVSDHHSSLRLLRVFRVQYWEDGHRNVGDRAAAVPAAVQGVGRVRVEINLDWSAAKDKNASSHYPEPTYCLPLLLLLLQYKTDLKQTHAEKKAV